MTNFTIEQLEALKEGTTPGPWKVRRDKWDGGLDCPEIISSEDNLRLAASAPALVDALIAEKRENQRIRKELEKAREIYRDDTFPEAPYRGSKGVVVRITRILEGES